MVLRQRKLGTNAMKRVAAGAHLPTPWLFEPAKRQDDRTDYCLEFMRVWFECGGKFMDNV